MNESILQYRMRLTQYWKQASKMQKYMILGTVVFLIAVLILTSINLSKTIYTPAFTNLQPNDAAAIKTYLDGAKIPYQLSTDGKNISVPESEAPSIKLDVESQGLNKSGSLGYAGTFGGSNTFGMSDNEFNVKLISAMQGEIQQMFNQINGVGNAKVLITYPKDTGYITTNKLDSTASVVLNIQQGYKFDQAQVDTMYNLVAKTVPKLNVDNITISDQNGQLMPYSKTGGGAINASSQVQQQFQIKNQFQTDLQKNIMNLLTTMIGPNKVVVSVVSALNFDQKSSSAKLVTPVNPTDTLGIPISVQENNKSSNADGAANGGVPGTSTTDVPTYQGTTSSGGKSSTEETNKIVNYEVNRITNDIISAPFIVKDLSINVGIDNDPNTFPQEMRDSVQRALTSIVNTSLADSGVVVTEDALTRKVTLFVQPFSINNVGTATAANNYLLWGGIGAAALVLAGLGGYLMRRRKRNEIIEEEIPAPVVVELPTIDMENASPENQMRKQLESLAKKKPEDFVNLLRTWLVDE